MTYNEDLIKELYAAYFFRDRLIPPTQEFISFYYFLRCTYGIRVYSDCLWIDNHYFDRSEITNGI